jgi:hypothetical protein
MEYNWYNIYNRDDFIAEDLVSKELEFDLEGMGLKTVMLYRGDGIGVVVDDVYLTVGLNDMNPFEFGGVAVYLDSNYDIWLGYPIED